MTERGDEFSEVVVHRLAMPAGIKGRPYVCWSRDRTGAADPERPFSQRNRSPESGRSYRLVVKSQEVVFLNHLDSTNVRESGILITVHSAESLESTGGLAIPSLLNP